MLDFQLTYRRFSECSILVEWPAKIDKNVLDDVLLFKNHLLNSSIKSIIHINTAYCSILIIYESTIDKINDEISLLKAQYSNRVSLSKPAFTQWRIPVCYHDDFALDLEEISANINRSKLDIIRLHSETIYTVFFIGFLPGFLYLGGLDKRLYFPRKKSPRAHIKKGAVGIGGFQTGIYPNASPGGWNIIGNCPLNLFNSKAKRPCFVSSGDRIQFYPVDIEEYQAIRAKVNKGTYQLESEVIDG